MTENYMKEYCNPINIEYKFQHYGKTAHRESADPTLVYFKGMYYLFASMSAGFYYSDDLINWKWHENRKLDMYRYAPDVHQKGEYLYFIASTRSIPSTIWRTSDPLSNKFEVVSKPLDVWDPALFFDDDGKSYLYWGCGNEPLFGIELDSNTMMPIGEKTQIIDENKEEHGWERYKCADFEHPKARNFLMKYVAPMVNPKGKPYMEGAYVNKWNDKYYFQYAAPGTELPVYGNAVYTSNKPLGIYEFQQHNPFSSKPMGFITGAGHGSTIEDAYGNFWHSATMRISVNQSFERRIGIFPAGLDEDGILFCNQNFADYPIVVPQGKFDPKEIQSHYMLLSYKKKGTASSCLNEHGTELALNEDIRTWWCANKSAGEWYQVDLGKEYTVHSIQLNLAEEGIPTQKYPKSERSTDISSGYRYVDSSSKLCTRYIMEGSVNCKDWFVIKDASKSNSDLSHDYVILPENTTARYIKVTAVQLAYEQKFAISGLRVFGLDTIEKPGQVEGVVGVRTSPLDAHIKWQRTSDAIGYNVRYGIAEDKLYSSYLMYDTNEVKITTLNKGIEYWCCVDSFNESGVTEGKIVKIQ